MHLKMLELTGFKSFPEAKVEFPPGITSVVGPNGTGKSNVVDAILWVLGEQSTKTLRSDRMEDVIFNGTQLRKPLGMAEVSLVFSGMAEHLPPGIPADTCSVGGFSEIMITRRLYRNGDSEYLINKTACRLKDIRGLLLDTRAGIKGHSVIEQGRLQQILDASPQDRRTLIEETAGIVRYKKQKMEALRKLQATQQNLLRVRDIIGEVRKQLNSLERQAKQAKNYQTLQQEGRTLEIRLWTREYRFLLQDRSGVEADLAALEAQEAALIADEGASGVRLEEARLRLHAGEDAIGRTREELAKIELKKSEAVTAIEVQRRSQTLLGQQRTQAEEDILRSSDDQSQAHTKAVELQVHLTQVEGDLVQQEGLFAQLESAGMALTERRNGALEQEEQARRGILEVAIQVAGGRNAQTELERRKEEGSRRSDRLALEEQDLHARYAGETERLRNCHEQRIGLEDGLRDRTVRESKLREQGQQEEQQLQEVDQQIGQCQQDLAGVSSRFRTLQGVFREETGYGREGEEETTSLRKACHGIEQAVAEWLIVPERLDRAVEAVLGERVRGWLVQQPVEAGEAIKFLKSRGLGRGAFVPLVARTQPKDHEHPPIWWPALQNQSGVLGRAIELVQARSESVHALACLFDRVVIVESLEVALRVWNENSWSLQDGPTVVTLDGEIVEPSGVVTGGLLNPVQEVLQRRREIDQLEEKQTALTETLKALHADRSELIRKGESLETTLQGLMKDIEEWQTKLLAISKEEASLKQNVDHLALRLETVRAEITMAENERNLLDAELQTAGERLASLIEAQQAHEAAHAKANETRLAIEGEIQVWQQQGADVRSKVEGLRATLRHSREMLDELLKQQEDAEIRIRTLRQQIDMIESQVRESEAELTRKTAIFQEMDIEGGRAHGTLVAAQEAHAAEQSHCQAVESELAQARGALVAARKSRTAVEIKRAEIATRMESLEGTLGGTYQLSVAEAFLREPELPGDETRDGAEETTRSLRDDLQRIRERVERMGPINLAAIDEHRELDERYGFLTGQEKDLTESIRSLKEIISRINRTTEEMFMDTFTELQHKFGEVFSRFFRGGRAELVLTAPEEGQESSDQGSGDSPREPGVEIVAQPPGKRLKSIAMLSGGEKTLTAMALIFASFLIKPTPFCILDEIDAPLDEENIGRFTNVLKELSDGAQFIVITHNKRTMSVADSLFGVTMEEPGVSKLVSVRLADLQLA